MKVQQATQLINPFGGIQFVLEYIKEQALIHLLMSNWEAVGPTRNTVYLMDCLPFTTAIFAEEVVWKTLIH